jgi:hypothetical protein
MGLHSGKIETTDHCSQRNGNLSCLNTRSTYNAQANFERGYSFKPPYFLWIFLSEVRKDRSGDEGTRIYITNWFVILYCVLRHKIIESTENIKFYSSLTRKIHVTSIQGLLNIILNDQPLDFSPYNKNEE